MATGTIHPEASAFGIGVVGNTLPVLADANSPTLTGFYSTESTTANTPTSMPCMILAVVRGTYRYQMLFDFYSNKRYERWTTDGTNWSAWAQI